MTEEDKSVLQSRLTAEQYHVTQEGGTEPPFTGKYDQCKDEGLYRCLCCSAPLFRSTEKYDSGSGWPSYVAPYSNGSIRELVDRKHGMKRTEVRCAQCDAHLGHVFPDGPRPSGLRYCINSASLDLDSTASES